MKGIYAVIAVASLLEPANAHAGEVIAHPSVNLSMDEIRDLFLGEKQFSGGMRLVAVDNTAIRPEFLAKVLQTDERKYVARWQRKSFREGLAAPALSGSDAEVVAFVKSTPGAVGYVSTRADGVKSLVTY